MRKAYSHGDMVTELCWRAHTAKPAFNTRRRTDEEVRLATASGRGISAVPGKLHWASPASVVLLLLALLAVLPAAQLSNGWRDLLGPWQTKLQPFETAHTCSQAVPTLPDFQLVRFGGQWHQVAWLPGAASVPRSKVAPCMAANFTGSAGGNFRVSFVSMPLPQGAVRDGVMGPEPVRQAGWGSTPDARVPARLEVQLEGGPKLPLSVFDTDYESYAVLHSCAMQLGGMQLEQVFLLLSRTPVLGPMDLGDCLNRLAALGLPWKNVAFSNANLCEGLLL